MEEAQQAYLAFQQRRKRASCYRMRKFLCGIGTLVVLMLVVTVITSAPTTREELQKSFFSNLTFSCTAHECDEQLNRQHLHTILSNMKSWIDPCTDYHSYACGNWRNLHTNGTTMLKLANEKIIKKYIDLFDRWQQDEENLVIASQNKLLNEVQEKMLKYYKVCRSLDSSGTLSLKGYLDQMTQQTKLWQLQDFDWLKALAELGSFGYSSHFIKFKFYGHNATYLQLQLEPHEALNRMKWNPEIGAEIREAIDEYDSKQRGEELRTVLYEFERNIVVHLTGDEENNVGNDEDDGDATEMTLAELSETTANLNMDWQHYVSKILGRKLELTHKIRVVNIGKIKKTVAFLQQQDTETIMLYTMIRFLNYIQDQRPNFLDAKTRGTSFNCIKHMRRIHFVAMNYIYELEYYSKERASSDAMIFGIFNSLKQEFKQIIEANDMHLNVSQLDLLLEKLHLMRLNIGDLPINVTPTFYSDYVRDLNISVDNFYHNHLKALQHFYAHKHSRSYMQDQQLNSSMHSFHLNELDYADIMDSSPMFGFNMIVLPFAYLELPFYSGKFWDILLYGDLANTLSHELIHGFDNNALYFDGNSKASKVVQSIMQNSNYKKNYACLDVETEFLSERIADVSGIKLTIRTFMRNAERKQHEWQLYFMQFAQFFCGSTDLASFYADDPFHDMDNLRLNYVLAQTPEFAEIYNCPLGSPLNPTKRCHMW